MIWLIAISCAAVVVVAAALVCLALAVLLLVTHPDKIDEED